MCAKEWGDRPEGGHEARTALYSRQEWIAVWNTESTTKRRSEFVNAITRFRGTVHPHLSMAYTSWSTCKRARRLWMIPRGKFASAAVTHPGGMSSTADKPRSTCPWQALRRTRQSVRAQDVSTKTYSWIPNAQSTPRLPGHGCISSYASNRRAMA